MHLFIRRWKRATNAGLLLKLQAPLAAVKLGVVTNACGNAPRSRTSAEPPTYSQSDENGSITVTSNLPFEEWTSVFGGRLGGGAP